MKSEIFNRFDMIMSSLKAVESSSSFDFEFRRRFKEAVAKKYEENILEMITRRTAERLRFILLPKAPVLVRTAATFVVLVAIGLYIYSIQPASPVFLSREGAVLVQCVKDGAFREVSPKEICKAGDTIVTEENSQSDIVLSGKYAIRLKERTKIRVAKLTSRYVKGRVRFELIEGKILVSIDEGFKGSSFMVDTEAATAKALGTKFAISTSRKEEPKTEVSVLEGKVEVKSHYLPEKILLAKQTVIVRAGQKTEVSPGQVPLTPQRLIEEEWHRLEELYQIGKKPQVILLVKNTPDRVIQLLRPCPIYISDEKPREIPRLLEDAVLKIEEAIKTEDKAKHLESIRLLERMLEEYPNPKYDVQFLLYIGAYYEYVSYHEEAIKTFEKVLENYPNSPLASLAQCAIGVIYEEKLDKIDKAKKAYQLVLDRYPNSLEAMWVEKGLRHKKIGRKP